MSDIVTIECDQSPKAIGPYSQAVKVNNMLYISGQIPLHPETGEVVGVDIASQTERAMENLKGILDYCGIDFGNVVKTTCYLDDMNEFADFNEVYAKYFIFNQPARATVEVSRLPKDVKVEIEAIASIPALLGAADTGDPFGGGVI